MKKLDIMNMKALDNAKKVVGPVVSEAITEIVIVKKKTKKVKSAWKTKTNKEVEDDGD